MKVLDSNGDHIRQNDNKSVAVAEKKVVGNSNYQTCVVVKNFEKLIKNHKELVMECDIIISNINELLTNSPFWKFLSKYNIPFKSLNQIDQINNRKLIKLAKKNKRLEVLSHKKNKRMYSSYINSIEKRNFSTSSSVFTSQGSCEVGGTLAMAVQSVTSNSSLVPSVYGDRGEGGDNKVYNQSSVSNVINKDKNIKDTSKIVMQNQMFNIIKDILSTNPINHETQLKIEELVFNGFKELLSDSDSIVKILGGFNSKLVSNHKFRAFVYNTIDNIKILLKELKHSLNKNVTKNKTKKARDQIILFEIILSNIDIKDLISTMITSFFNILTYNMVKKEDETGDYFFQTSLVNISIEIGKKIVGFYVRKLYKDACLYINLTEFKDKLMTDPSHNIIDNTEFLVFIGSGLIQIMKESGLVEDKVVKVESKKNQSLITITSEVLDLCGEDLVNKAIAIPLNLPMIVEPKEYININSLCDGGYLLNNKEIIHSLFTDNLLQTEQSSVIKDNKIIECLNGIMKIPFKINTQLLEYILNNPGFVSFDINPPYSNLKKRNKVQEREYQK